MKTFRDIEKLPQIEGSVVTIGNFDGIHLGHQKIIAQLKEHAEKLKVPSVVISFNPTPQNFFGADHAVLSSYEEKDFFLSSLGINYHLVINFNKKFSNINAQTFIEEFLLRKLNIKHCLIGDDFRFGKNRVGNFSLLQENGDKHGFAVEETATIKHNQIRISSTRIRECLQQNNLEETKKLLGRSYSISGKIVRGQQRGRTINFPTINILPNRSKSPVSGVFAVKVKLSGQTYFGICNAGHKPTVNGREFLFETHIFDFEKDVYEQFAEIVFLKHVRPEKKFNSFAELKDQIEKDVIEAKKFFKLTSS
ncbi:MAG: bifunctional riboflavin kinase/FAD synthetase [Gammaproteobacteria bacterium]|nr:bifunctional riboflavin kinase/FAD synthetase [Gammaproteobacteria bacterium]